jgi:FAD/FMN-containing dehydrogenase
LASLLIYQEFSYAASNYKDSKCVYAPRDARGVAFAVQTIIQLGTKFAVRSGGHMPIAGSNNIDAPGVLLSMTNLNGLALNEDNKVVSVGASVRWSRVYDYLAEAGLVVVGGRLGENGVSGLLPGGGLSFYSGQHGFASDNVAKYEVSTCQWFF